MARPKVLPGVLPLQKKETWQGGWFRTHLWVHPVDGPPSRPWISLLTSLDDPFVTAGDVSEERGSHEDIASLLDKAFEERGRRPGRIEVSDPDLETFLSERLAASAIDVVRREKLAAAEHVLAAMARDFGAPDLPGALDVPGITIESMRSFAKAASEFFRSRPWRHLSDRDVIEIRGGAPAGFRYAVVLGMAGASTGLGFFDDLEAFWDVLAGEGNPTNLWNLTYGSIVELPPDDANLWVDHGLDVAERAAYPVALCIQSANRVKRPSPRILDFLTGLLRALAASGPAELDRGRWEMTVESIASSREYDLVLPFYLEPPSRAELARRRVLPDRRSFERLHFLFENRFRELPAENVEELNEILMREIGNRPIDEVPYEPRNDRERAQELCFEAFDAWGRRQGEFLERALALDPGCIDALVLKAERTPDAGDKLRLYEAAVASGATVLDSDELPEDVEGNLWTYYPTRPYLRALHSLAHALEDRGDSADAIERFRLILSLDEGDHQSVRHCLLGSLLTSGRFQDAERHIKRYQSPDECVWAYSRALAAFGRYKDKKTSQQALDRALEVNPFAAAWLMGMDLGEPDPETERDAEHCAREIGRAWSMTEGALDWLGKRLDAKES